MRILCTENKPGAAHGAVEQLRADGHDVLHCFERGAPMCVGLDRAGACPLDDPRGVDVVLERILHHRVLVPAWKEDM